MSVAPTSRGVTSSARRTVRRTALALTLTALAAVAGWQAPQVIERINKPSYVGQEAVVVADDLGCVQYRQDAQHDDSVYEYRDRGTCLLDNVRVTITTFDDRAHGEAFLTLMNGLIPVVHPDWKGAATAAGDGWNVADTRNLSPQVAEEAVRRLGAGAVRIIPSAQRS